ncbi:DUF4097 domain-containing protein [Caldibacillus lycopersici]|uniref:DUF4097 domain-containing protein n=1 Tax=Perspicuibacillus lycopersici TaxID=1325689 RepID=A0AAE3IU14_9BACI|nr:DUF4097 domain-containing protein [Perspicuibacillus lycopersici]MCU9613429.1 DUF4097 domain-containing protein [Perspicuibacillus lycopersici]
MINKKKLSIIAAIIILIGIIGSLLTFRSITAVDINEKKVVTNQQVAKIEINTNNTRVNIQPTTENNITLTLDGKAPSNHKQTFTAEVEASTLLITIKDKHINWFSFNIFDVFKPLTLNVYLPEKQYESLQVASNNGYVSAKQLNALDFHLETDNGRIDLTEIQAQQITAVSDNGRIDMKDSVANTIHVATKNGKLTLDDVAGELEGITNNGSITLFTKELNRNLDLKTDNGRISIKTEKEPTNAEFQIDVDNGKVNILDKYQGNTVIGNGEYLIKLSSDNGSISVTNESFRN